MRPNPRSPRTSAVRTASETDRGRALVLCVAAWLVPGAGHLLQHRLGRGLTCLFVLPLMFALGLALQGRIFPFDFSQPLVALQALADLSAGVPYLIARALGYGAGNVVAVTYEYGNTFLVVAGLLNTLVAIDAYDISMGRK